MFSGRVTKAKPTARRRGLVKVLSNYSRSIATAGLNFIFTVGYLSYYFVQGSVRSYRGSRLHSRAVKKYPLRASKRVALCVLEIRKNLLAGAAEVKFRWGLLPHKQRASFLKFSALSLITLAGYLAFHKVNKEPYPPSWPHPERRGIGLANFKRDPTCAPFEYFKNPKVVLFLTTGIEGKAISNQILTYLSGKPDCVTINSDGSIKKINFYPQNGSPVEIFIVNISSVNPSDLKQHLSDRKAELIFYRGHTNEMVELVKRGSNFEARHCLGIMGGCNSADFINKVHTPETPTAGVQGIAYTSRNNHWSYHILVGLCDPRVGSWEQLRNYLYGVSETASQQLVLPGTASYNTCFTESTD